MFVLLACSLLSPWNFGDEVCPGDLARFPADRAMADAYHWMATEQREWAEKHGRAVPWGGGYKRWAEARRAEYAWYHLHGAWALAEQGSPPRLVWERLHDLRNLIGPDNYRAGVMPDPVPHRRVMP